jgi:hypothetical protein
MQHSTAARAVAESRGQKSRGGETRAEEGRGEQRRGKESDLAQLPVLPEGSFADFSHWWKTTLTSV